MTMGEAGGKPSIFREHFVAVVLAALIVGGLFLRLWAIRFYGEPPRSDALSYHVLAVNMVRGNPYSRDASPPFRPEYQRTFGYPAFVAAIYAVAGPNPRAVWLVQAFLATLVIPLLWDISRRILPSSSRWPPLIAGALAAFNPMQIHASALLLREALMSVLVASTVWLVLVTWAERRTWQWALVGVMTGVAALVRPEAIVIAVAVPAALLYVTVRTGESWRRVGIVSVWIIVPTVAALAPWVHHYHANFGEWGLGPDEYIGPIQRASAIYRQADSTTDLGRLFRRYRIDPTGADPAATTFRLIDGIANDDRIGFVGAARRAGGAGREFVSLHPGRWLMQSVTDGINFSLGYSELAPFIGKERQRRFVELRYTGLWREGDYGTLLIFLFARAGVGLLVLFGASVAAVRWLFRPEPGLAIAAVLLGVVLPTALTGTYAPRVRVPLDPLLVACAVIGWTIALGWLRNTRYGKHTP